MANIYVNHTGSATPPYDTEAKAATDIQVALDAANSGDTVLIKADQNYVMDGNDQQAAQFDVDANDSITIKGYYLNPDDQDYGGAYYKDSSHGWVVIDANNGSFNVFSAGDYKNLVWLNIKVKNVSGIFVPFDLSPSTDKYEYMIQNCWTTGGCQSAIKGAHLCNPIIRDCTFTGTYSEFGSSGVIYLDSTCNRGAIIQDCNFSHGDAPQSINASNWGMSVIYNSTFNINGTVTDVIKVINAALILNNTIYENSGGAVANGVDLASPAKSCSIFNNIIVGCTKGIDDAATVNFGGWNCFYNNGSDWTLRDGDMIADPQFMDAANGDFKLKPTSPCLNTGKPTLDSGYTSIGTWQRKSLLR